MKELKSEDVPDTNIGKMSEIPTGAEVLDKIRAEIEHMIPYSKEALSIKLGVLDIIDKYKASPTGGRKER